MFANNPNPKRRKISDLTTEETAAVVEVLRRFHDEIDDDDDDGNEVITAVQTVLRKLNQVKRVPLSDATALSLVNANIKVEVLNFKNHGRDNAQDFGRRAIPNAFTLDETRRNIEYIRKHVAFETEAGCRVLINAILLHVATNLDTEAQGVAIAPELRIPSTVFEIGGTSYAGVVDYMMVLGKRSDTQSVVLSPQFALTDESVYRSLSCNIYEAKPDKTLPAIAQAAMAAAVQSQRFGFSTFRGSITTGEEWLFFVYNKDPHGPGGRVSYLPPIRLERELNGLNLVLGLLYDCIENGHQKSMKFCIYPH